MKPVLPKVAGGGGGHFKPRVCGSCFNLRCVASGLAARVMASWKIRLTEVNFLTTQTKKTIYPIFTIWREDWGQRGGLCWPLSGEVLRAGLHSSSMAVLKPWTQNFRMWLCGLIPLSTPFWIQSDISGKYLTKCVYGLITHRCFPIMSTYLYSIYSDLDITGKLEEHLFIQHLQWAGYCY